MKNHRLVLCVLLVSLAAPVLRAEEPYLDFVHALAADGKADLAVQYLEQLNQKPPAELKEVLPLELAKARLALAAVQPEAGSRAALRNQALADLSIYTKTPARTALAAEAAFEVARIAALQGQDLLSEARRDETAAGQRKGLLRARAQLETAAKQLQAARAQLEQQRKTADTERLRLAEAHAELEIGIDLLQQAQTYTESKEVTTRAALLKKARDEVLDKLARREPRTALGWQALAWIGRCHFEDDDPKKARKVYMDVINAEAGEEAEAGRRLARYYRMQALAKDPDQKKALQDIVTAGEEWLRLYPHEANTPEGCGVRFELAKAYLHQARALGKTSSPARVKYENARRQFQLLEQSENDYTTAAHEQRLNIVRLLAAERPRGEIGKLRDFEESYIRAEFESAEIARLAKEQPGAPGQRSVHFKNMVEALNHALDLADAQSVAEEVRQARLLLAYGYLALEDDYAAVVVGEELARNEPRCPQAPLAGAYALSAYAQLIARQEAAGTPREALAVDRERQRKLAEYLERTWPATPAADVARHVLGLQLLGDKRYAEAVDELERIAPTSPNSTRAFNQLAAAAFEAQKNELPAPPGKPPYEARALAALARIPELAPTADRATIHDYFAAKFTLADVYFKSKQYEKLEALARSLGDSLQGLEPNVQAEFRTPAASLLLYAKLGRGEIEYKAGHYRQAQELLAPVVQEFLDPNRAADRSELKEKNPQLVRALLSLALRANVQDNQVARGQQILDQLQKLFPENSGEILIQLVQQLRLQLQELRQQGGPASAAFKKTVASFSTFLDQLAQQQEKQAKPDTLLFLGQSYSTLDKHARAAALFHAIKEDAPPAVYHLARVLYVRELRLGKEFAKAETALQEVLASDWGKQHLEAKKEHILLLEDQEKYQLSRSQGAIPEWNQLMQALRPKLQDNRIKEQYFDCYYHLTLCIYRNALKKTDAKQKQKDLHLAATFIVKLEQQPDTGLEPFRKRFQELLEQEPPLKSAYEAIKQASPANK